MLDEAYSSSILLRDCIVGAMKYKIFYVSIISTVVLVDPHTLHTQHHKCVRQQGLDSHTSSLTSKQIYHMEEDHNNNDFEFGLCCTDRGSSIFNCRIMHGSSSFSPQTSNNSLSPAASLILSIYT